MSFSFGKKIFFCRTASSIQKKKKKNILYLVFLYYHHGIRGLLKWRLDRVSLWCHVLTSSISAHALYTILSRPFSQSFMRKTASHEATAAVGMPPPPSSPLGWPFIQSRWSPNSLPSFSSSLHA